MAITKNEDIKVGEFVYKTIGAASYRTGVDNRRSLKLAITKVNSKFFTTEDGSQWTISKYTRRGWNSDTSVRWELRAGNARSEDVCSEPTFPVVTREELNKEAEAAQARSKAEQEAKDAELKAKVETMDGTEIGYFIDETVKTGSYSETRMLANARQHMTPEQLQEYIARLEYALVDKQRTVRRAADTFRSYAERLTHEVENLI